jgi:hypothetical protein
MGVGEQVDVGLDRLDVDGGLARNLLPAAWIGDIQCQPLQDLQGNRCIADLLIPVEIATQEFPLLQKCRLPPRSRVGSRLLP